MGLGAAQVLTRGVPKSAAAGFLRSLPADACEGNYCLLVSGPDGLAGRLRQLLGNI